MMIFYPKTVAELKTAIEAANANSAGSHIINLTSGATYKFTERYTATPPPLPATPKNALPTIQSTITIIGNNTLLERASGASSFRFFHVLPGKILSLKGLILKNGYVDEADDGGGITNEGGTIQAIGCQFVGNKTDGNDDGGAIYNFAHGSVTFINCTFSGNYAQDGGAIANIEGNVNVLNCRLFNNTATRNGGGVYNHSFNTISPTQTKQLVIKGCTINGNTATGYGGGIGAIGGTLNIENNVIYGNKAISGNGGSIYCLGGSVFPLQTNGSIIQKNRIYSNRKTSVYNGLSSNPFNAFNNWWGASNGPSGAGSGIGDSISVGINWQPPPPLSSPISVHDGIGCLSFGNSDGASGPNPISLRLGEKRLELTDFSFQTPAGTLNFTRWYRQFKQTDDPYSIFRLMGLGWTHNHNYRLIDETSGTPPRLILISPDGGSIFFDVQISSTPPVYQAATGSTAQIQIDTASTTARYVMTSADKSIYEFDSSKKLRKITFPNKEYWIYRYFGDDAGESTHFAKGELKEVIDDGNPLDATTKRKLQFVYLQNPTFLNGGTQTPYAHSYLLWRIGDHTAASLTSGSPTGRYVELAYMPERNNSTLVTNPKALLASVSDVRDKTRLWTYNYYGQIPGENIASQLNWMTQRKTPSVDTNGDNIADAILTPESLTYGTHTIDLASNGGMELDDLSWEDFGTPTTNQRSAEQFYPDGGTYSRKVVTDEIGEGIQGTVWGLVKGRQYTITAKVFITALSGGTVKMQVTGITAFDQSTNVSGSWQTLTATHTPTATTDCRLQFVTTVLGGGGNTTFYVDSVLITETNALLTQKRGFTGTNPASLLDVTYKFAPGLDYSTEEVVGLTTTHQFQAGMYAGLKDAAAHRTELSIGTQFRVSNQQDANGNPTALDWSSDGKFLNGVTDAGGNQTSFDYNLSGVSADTLNFSIDAEGRKTQYIYGDTTNNPRLPTTIKIFDTDGTTVLRWQEFTYDPKGRTLTEKQINPANGTTVLQETTREYYTTDNGNGLLKKVTQTEIGGSNNSSTEYTYDSAGRVIQVKQSTTFGDCCGTLTQYDAAGNVTQTTNVRDWLAQSDPIKCPVTTYGYDEIGRRVRATINVGTAAVQTTLTFYDALDRVVRTITNYINQSGGAAETPGAWVWSSANNRWEKGVGNTTAISHGTDNTQNIISDTQYNARGMVKLQRDTLGNITLFGYDDAGRLVKTIQNASIQSALFVPYNNDYVAVSGAPNATPDPDLSEYGTVTFPYSTNADQDVFSLQTYDAVGNLVKTQDVLGTVNYTVYDALNRPIKTVRAAKSTATISVNPFNADGSPNPSYDATNDPRSSSYVPSTLLDRDIIESTIYDALGRVVQQIDVNGRISLTVYDSLGRVSKTISNYVVQLDGSSQPTDPQNWYWDTAANPKQWKQSSTVGAPAISHGAKDDQNIITWTKYDPAGRMMWTQDILGRRTWTKYDGLGRVVKTIGNAVGTAEDGTAGDPRSNSYVPSTASDQDRITITTYDGNGRVQWTQDPNGRKNWNVYDSLGRIKKTIANCTFVSGTPAPESDSYVGSSNADDDIITRTTYNDAGQVYQTYDALNRETRHFYDILGRRSKTITNYVDGIFDPLQPDRDLIQITDYDRAGRVIKTTDMRGTQTTFSYDRAGRRLTVTQAANTLLATTSYTCYDKAGRVLRTVANWRNAPGQPSPDAKDISDNWLFNPATHGADNDCDLITLLDYDRLGRRLKVTDPLGNFSQTVYFKDGTVDAVIDPENVTSKFRYDQLRRRFRVVQSYVVQGTSDPANWVWEGTTWKQAAGGTGIVHGTNQDQNIIVDVVYDRAGRVTSQREPRGNLTSYDYDQLDRRTKLKNPLLTEWNTAYTDVAGGKTRTTITYPGLSTGGSYPVQREFDRAGRLASMVYGSPTSTPDVQMTYDKAGNRLKMSEYAGANFTSRNRETTFGYDQARRLTSVGFDNDGNGTVDETVSYEYDAGGLRTKLTLPGSLSISYNYDCKGQLCSLKDWDSQESAFGYDKAGRHAATWRPNGLNTRYDHDAAGRLQQIRHHERNKMLSRFQYTLDKRGNRTQAFEQLANPATVTTTIDKANAAVTYDAGTWTDNGVYKQSNDFWARMKITFTGNEGALTVATGNDHGIFDVYIDGSLWESFDGYAAVSGERVINLYLTSSGTHTLEIRNRPQRNAANTIGYKVRFKQLAVLNTVYDTQTISYVYDALARLLSATYAGVTPSRSYQYAFDRAGNRTQQVINIGGTPTTTNYTYNNANQITNAGFVYDANGNLTNDGTNAYAWDRANRPLSMGGASHKYDGQGHRVQQTVGATVTKYLLDLQPGLSVVLSQDVAGSVTRHIHAIRGIHAHKDAANNWEWMEQDGLGSVRSVTNKDNGVLWHTNYDGYGNPFGAVGTAQTNYGFTGELLDGGGLLDVRARRYNPVLGILPSLDPFEGVRDRAMSLNGYSWVEGNVVNAGDPSGMSCMGDALPESCCGPDVTDWFRKVVNSNANYQGGSRSYQADPIEVARLLQEGNILGIINYVLGLNVARANEEAKPIIYRLAVYGLAVRTVDIDYIAMAGPRTMVESPSNFVTPAPKPNYLPRKEFGQQVVTLCNRCINSSDLGNFLFGLAGAAWGIDFNTVTYSAQVFNGLSEHNWGRETPDIQGVIAGQVYYQSYSNVISDHKDNFCGRLALLTQRWQDKIDTPSNAFCKTASLDNAPVPIPYWNGYIFSGLPRRADADPRPSTPEQELSMFFDRFQFNR